MMLLSVFGSAERLGVWVVEFGMVEQDGESEEISSQSAAAGLLLPSFVVLHRETSAGPFAAAFGSVEQFVCFEDVELDAELSVEPSFGLVVAVVVAVD
jgi:hypothetical protein